MSSEKTILAVDLGTSGPKVALVTARGDIIGSAFEPTGLILLPGGGAEQDPADWWQAISKAAKRALAQNRTAARRIAAVCCTSQWSGTVAVNADGRPLMNAIIWMDARGAEPLKAITGGPIRMEGYSPSKLLRWLRLTGGAPSHVGKDPLAHIAYIKQAHPDIYAQTYKFLEPKDYLNLRLTGQFAASFDSIALHWVTDNRDLRRVDYDGRLLQIAGLPRQKLPDLRRAVDMLGPILPEIAAEWGVPPQTPVVMGAPDVQSAAIGSGAVSDFAGHLYIGTSAWLTCHVPFKKTDLLHNMASLPSAIPERYLVANEQETAGACLNFLRDNLLYQDDGLGTAVPPADFYARLDRIAETVAAGSDGALFTPWLYGERTPVDDHTIRGGFYNLSLPHQRAHLIRAVFEGVAFNGRWLLKYVEKFIGRRMDGLNMIGGGANSDIWCQIHADVFDRPIRQVRHPIQANVRGAAFLAAAALGLISFSDIPQLVPIARTYQPNPAHRAIYDELFAEFLQLYQQNRKIYARLNRHPKGFQNP